MISRLRNSMMLSLLLAVVMIVPALAGGWAVITLDQLPANVQAGKPIEVGFTVRQHGRTPMSDLATSITMISPAGRTYLAYPTPEGKPGHYTVSLTFQSPGEWMWSIQAFTMDQPMPAIFVGAPTIVDQAVPEPAAEPFPVMWIIRFLAFGLGAIAFLIAAWRGNRFAGALTAICLAIGVGSFVIGSNVPAADAASQVHFDPASPSQVDLGQRLFVAKGCVTCHVNDRVPNHRDFWTIDGGAPNLSHFSASPEILRIRLKDPVAAKADTQMPNLELSDTEIEALIAFINSR